jgi:uncharacterized protein YndB with AHSA1/START domain
MNGKLERTADGPRLRFSRRLAHPIATVWRAVTEPEHLKAWFPDTIEVERWEPGARLRFDGFDGEVLAVRHEALLEFRWGTDTIRIELEPDGDGTTLTLLDSFDELGKAARDGAGWHVCLDQLEHDLDGTTAPWSSADRWQDVHPGYVEDFGPEASAIGPPSG